MNNADGESFFNEDDGMRNFTHAKFDRAVLGQSCENAFKVWDANGVWWHPKEVFADNVLR